MTVTTPTQQQWPPRKVMFTIRGIPCHLPRKPRRFFNEVSGRGLSAVIGLVLGGLIAWLYGRWRRRRERLSIVSGDARDTVVIQHHIVERADGRPAALRIRALGQSQVRHVVPNGHLAGELLHRAEGVTARDTLISMEGAGGSYLLETLTNFLCDRLANAPFDHDLYVMAPCCEPRELTSHQPISILLIAVSDLALFADWTTCRDVCVEHRADGSRVLTLMELARRYRDEQDELHRLRAAGKRTRHVETMYLLDLALDRRTVPISTRPIPWGRFEGVLKQLNLE